MMAAVKARIASTRQAAIGRVRQGLRRLAGRRLGRRYLEVAIGELTSAVKDTVDEARYGSAYFGRSRPKHTAAGVTSGYARYDRASSNLDIASYLIWRFLPPGRVVDVGAALGYLVEGLRDLGVDAIGIEYSEYAARNASPGAAGHVLQGDVLAGLPLRDGYADTITCLEVLEHLPPDAIPAVAAELRRVCRGFLFITTPSIGPNPFGPDGFLERKVREDRLDAYYALGPDYSGPVPHEDLYRDADGLPIEGHLTVASYAWWTERFETAGFLRCGETERRIHPHIRRFGMANMWNLYVFRVPEVDEPVAGFRGDDEAAEAERRFGLRERAQGAPPANRYSS